MIMMGESIGQKRVKQTKVLTTVYMYIVGAQKNHLVKLLCTNDKISNAELIYNAAILILIQYTISNQTSTNYNIYGTNK